MANLRPKVQQTTNQRFSQPISLLEADVRFVADKLRLERRARQRMNWSIWTVQQMIRSEMNWRRHVRGFLKIHVSIAYGAMRHCGSCNQSTNATEWLRLDKSIVRYDALNNRLRWFSIKRKRQITPTPCLSDPMGAARWTESDHSH